MCAQFELEKSMFTEKIKKLSLDTNDFSFNHRILPHSKSPVLIKNENKPYELEVILPNKLNYKFNPVFSNHVVAISHMERIVSSIRTEIHPRLLTILSQEQPPYHAALSQRKCI